MAWVTPPTRVNGDIITAAIWNQDVKDNTQYNHDALRAGVTNFRAECFSNTQVTIACDYVTLVDGSGNLLTLTGASTVVDITGSVGQPNALDAGAEAGNTHYYIWWISNGTLLRGLLSTSASSPTMPSGYTHKLLATTVRNDGSSNFIHFLQTGNIVRCSNATAVASAVTGTGTITASTVVSPLARQIEFDLTLTTTGTGLQTVSATLSHPSGFDSATVTFVLDGAAGSPSIRWPMDVVCSATQTVTHVVSTDDTLTAHVRGWVNRAP